MICFFQGCFRDKNLFVHPRTPCTKRITIRESELISIKQGCLWLKRSKSIWSPFLSSKDKRQKRPRGQYNLRSNQKMSQGLNGSILWIIYPIRYTLFNTELFPLYEADIWGLKIRSDEKKPSDSHPLN